MAPATILESQNQFIIVLQAEKPMDDPFVKKL
jgi:hypothetical protein